MRILNIIPQLSGGGAERQLSYLAPELARMGHEVHIAYSTKGPCCPDLPGVFLHQLKSQSSYDPYLLWQLIRIIQRIKPTIIQTWILQMDILGGIAAMLCSVPWIFREPSAAIAYSLSWKNRLRVWVGATARAIISNSRSGAEYWESQLPHKRRYIIQNGLPVDEIDKARADLLPELAKANLPIILYVGRLTSDVSASKNLHAFLETLACVRHQQSVLGILCGEGPQRAELEALKNKLGLDKHIYFTGYLPSTSVWALMKKASVFVSLSSFEGCPNAVIEAMACGCPLVVSDIPGHREFLDERCTLFVDPTNIQKTAAAIIKTLRDTDNSKERALISKQKTQEWTINKMAINYERIYKGSL